LPLSPVLSLGRFAVVRPWAAALTERRDDLARGELAASDAMRIGAEILGTDAGTDPFVAAVRATRMPMIITDPRQQDNPVVFTNDAFCRLTGYTRQEILGRNCRFLQGPETDPETIQRIRDAISTARAIEIDVRNYRKGGEPFWNRLLVAPVLDAEGRLAYFFASQVDVTLERDRMAGLESRNAALVAELGDRLRAQEESESRLRFATLAGLVGIGELDLVLGELVTSAICRENFGRDPTAPFTYDDLRASIHAEDAGRMKAAMEHSIGTGQDYQIDCRVMRADGRVGWVQIRAQVSTRADGTPVLMAGTSLDITRRKEAELRTRALLELDDRFRLLESPGELAYAAAEVLGKALNVSRAGYGSVDTQAETITVERDWNAPGIKTIAGTLKFRDHKTTHPARRRRQPARHGCPRARRGSAILSLRAEPALPGPGGRDPRPQLRQVSHLQQYAGTGGHRHALGGRPRLLPGRGLPAVQRYPQQPHHEIRREGQQFHRLPWLGQLRQRQCA
jgi:PAS domain S-box-containing protein